MCILEKIVVNGDESNQPQEPRGGTDMLSLSIVDCVENSVGRDDSGETSIVGSGNVGKGRNLNDDR